MMLTYMLDVLPPPITNLVSLATCQPSKTKKKKHLTGLIVKPKLWQHASKCDKIFWWSEGITEIWVNATLVSCKHMQPCIASITNFTMQNNDYCTGSGLVSYLQYSSLSYRWRVLCSFSRNFFSARSFSSAGYSPGPAITHEAEV